MNRNFLRENWLYISLGFLFLIITIIILISAQQNKQLWSLNTISAIGSWASLIGFIVVIKQLFDIETKTTAINQTYSKTVYSLVYNETINKLSKARETIDKLKINFRLDDINACESDFDFLFAFLTELDNFTEIKGFEDKINAEQLSQFISYTQQMIFKLFEPDVNKTITTQEYEKLYELETFLINTNNKFKITSI